MARILLGEDETLVRNLLTLMLEHEHHAVTAVADGDAALAALRDETYDLAIVDVRMAGMSGLEALERAAREGHPVRALILTGNQDDELVRAAARRLGARVRSKPIRRVELLEEVNALLG